MYLHQFVMNVHESLLDVYCNINASFNYSLSCTNNLIILISIQQQVILIHPYNYLSIFLYEGIVFDVRQEPSIDT